MDDATVVYEDVETAFFDRPKQKNTTRKKTQGKKQPVKKSKSKKKQGLKLEYNAPVTLTFCLLSFAAFIFLYFFSKEGFILFSCPTKQGTEFAFSASSASHYIRIFTYIFGYLDWNQFLFTLSFLLLLGPNLEFTYGSKLLVLMIFISAFITGVLSACFSPVTIQGASSLVFMMVILSTYSAIEKKRIPLSLILVCAIFLTQQIFFTLEIYSSFLPVVFYIIGGFLGCLFGFLATPSRKN